MLKAAIEQFGDKSEDEIAFGKNWPLTSLLTAKRKKRALLLTFFSRREIQNSSEFMRVKTNDGVTEILVINAVTQK